MIKCIISDLGDVLVKNNPERACRRLARSCPHKPDEVAWFAPLSVHKLMDTGKVSKAYLYRQAVKNLGLRNVSQKRFEQIYGDIFTNNRPVQVILRKLSRNYRLVILSNTDAIHFEYLLKNFPFLKIFDRHVVSYKVGFVKPHARIFRAALKKAGCRASECVFIDDKKANVAGARKLGIKAIQFRSAVQLKRDFKRLGLKF